MPAVAFASLRAVAVRTPTDLRSALLLAALGAATGAGPWAADARGQAAAPQVGRQLEELRAGQRLQGVEANAGAPREKAAEERDFAPLSGPNARNLWRGYREETFPQGWELADGVLHRTAKGGDLVTQAEYDHFDLRFEWKVAAGANSGVMYRVALGDPAPFYSGPEYQVLDDGQHADGKKPLTSAGALYGMFAPSQSVALPAGQWNAGRIVVRGKRVRHFLNGVKIVDVRIDSPEWQQALATSKFAGWTQFARTTVGRIALQDHGDEVWYRNLRVKRLPPPRRQRSPEPAAASDAPTAAPRP